MAKELLNLYLDTQGQWLGTGVRYRALFNAHCIFERF